MNSQFQWSIEEVEEEYYNLSKLADCIELSLTSLKKMLKILLESSSPPHTLNEDMQGLNAISERVNIVNTLKDAMLGISVFYSKHLDFFYQIASGILHSGNTTRNKLKIYNLKNHEVFNITHDFFKMFDQEFATIFDDTFYHNRYNLIHIQQLERSNRHERGECYPIIVFNKPYIRLIKHGTIRDICSFSHEVMHGIEFKYNNILLLTNIIRALTSEVAPLFSELVLGDYLLQLGFDSRDIYKSHRLTSQYINTYSKSYYVVAYANKVLETNPEATSLPPLPFTYQTINAATHTNMHQNIKYVVSYLIALELYAQYNEDKDKGIYNLKQLMKYDGNNLYELLQGIDIEPDSLPKLTTYRTHIEEANVKVLGKRKKNTN